jgi:hypothetical protein
VALGTADMMALRFLDDTFGAKVILAEFTLGVVGPVALGIFTPSRASSKPSHGCTSPERSDETTKGFSTWNMKTTIAAQADNDSSSMSWGY